MPDNINDFVDNWKKWDNNFGSGLNMTWNRRFKEAGYYKVSIKVESSEWKNILTWCEEHIGQRYIWVGGTNPKLDFWFERSEDAVLFALTWNTT